MQNSIVVLKGSCLGSKTIEIESKGMIFFSYFFFLKILLI